MHKITTLSNGIRVVSERIPYLKSISIGVWIGNGSRYEQPEENGISHFIEHMLFKGTEHRTAADIAREMDAVGGQLNAFTAKEYTCFHTRTLDTHVELAADILSDMIFRPLITDEDMELERHVIIEEINMYEDSPEDVVYDLICQAAWGDTALGRPILGTPETLAGITPEIMRAYMKSHYTSNNIVISVSGNFDDSLFELLERKFGEQKLSDILPIMPEAKYKTARIVKQKDIEQTQIVAGFKGIDVMDDEVYSLMVFNNVFGNGMSSRLFQNIREKLGLVYYVSAGHSSYIGTGMFDISAGLSAENLKRVGALISEEIKTVKRDKLTADEVATAKEQLKGNYILSYESTGARMQAAGRSLLLNKPVYSQEEGLKMIEAVTTESVADIIDRVLDTSTLCTAAVGAVDTLDGVFEL